MKNQKAKKYFFYYLKENILVFDVSCYIDELAVHVIDFFFEWQLLKQVDDQTVIQTHTKLVKELLERKIEQEIIDFKEVVINNNCKMLSFYTTNSEPKEWKKYFSDPLKFLKICKKVCKKNLPNFYEVKIEKPLFLKRKGTFLDFACVIPSGNDDEFIIKALDKLKK